MDASGSHQRIDAPDSICRRGTESDRETPQGLGMSLGAFRDGNRLEEIVAISDKSVGQVSSAYCGTSAQRFPLQVRQGSPQPFQRAKQKMPQPDRRNHQLQRPYSQHYGKLPGSFDFPE